MKKFLPDYLVCIVQPNKKGKFQMKIAIDAMGGDHAPEQIVLGAMEAVSQIENVSITLIGDENKIKPFLTNDKNITIIHTDEVIRSEEHTSELQSRFDLVCRLLLE